MFVQSNSNTDGALNASPSAEDLRSVISFHPLNIPEGQEFIIPILAEEIVTWTASGKALWSQVLSLDPKPPLQWRLLFPAEEDVRGESCPLVSESSAWNTRPRAWCLDSSQAIARTDGWQEGLALWLHFFSGPLGLDPDSKSPLLG